MIPQVIQEIPPLWSSKINKYHANSGSYSIEILTGDDEIFPIPKICYLEKYHDSENLMVFITAFEKVNTIKNCYKMINQESIFKFLSANDNYNNILIDISNNIYNYFENNTELMLELLDTFEEREPPKLRIIINTQEEIIKANKRLKNFRINWFFNKYDPISTKIMFTLGFR